MESCARVYLTREYAKKLVVVLPKPNCGASQYLTTLHWHLLAIVGIRRLQQDVTWKNLTVNVRTSTLSIFHAPNSPISNN